MQTKTKGFVLILSSPSGCGKTTVARRLLKDDDNLVLSVSATTRKPREGEIEGKDYFFLSNEQFENSISNNCFLEHAEVFGKHYGTPENFVQEKLNEGKNLVFDIDWQGVEQLKKKIPKDIVSIFMLPPSIEELRKRLVKRNSDHTEEIEKRIREATLEISKAGEYDYIIINDDLEETIHVVKNIIVAEKHKKLSKSVFEAFQKIK